MEELIRALKVYIDQMIENERRQKNSHFLLARYVAAESVDANLSRLSLPDGTELRGIPRIDSSITFSPGNTVVCIGVTSTMPLIIIGRLVGNISLYGV